MENSSVNEQNEARRSAALNTLAIVGFIALILIGIALAIWSVRYIPAAFNGGAASLSSFFTPAEEEAGIEVISGTQIPFEPVATTSEPVAPAPVEDTPSTGTTGGVTYGQPTTIMVPVTVPPPAPYGLADLTVDITAVGYCRTDDTDSFRRASEVPEGENGGVQFAIRNAGTNTSSRFDFTYEVPTSPETERTVSNQRALGPGDRIDYTLCFTEPRDGDNRTISIRVDSGNDVRESNESNNSDSERIDIES
jgi:CARDB